MLAELGDVGGRREWPAQAPAVLEGIIASESRAVTKTKSGELVAGEVKIAPALREGSRRVGLTSRRRTGYYQPRPPWQAAAPVSVKGPAVSPGFSSAVWKFHW